MSNLVHEAPLAAGQPISFLRRLVQTLFYRDGVSILSVLAIRDYRNLWIGQMISFIGDSLAYNTMIFAIIRMARDAGVSYGKILSDLFVLSALPALVIGMIAGTVVDRANRKHLMIAADIIRGFLALGFLLVRDIDQVWIYVVFSVALSAVSTFFFPARGAIMPLILGRDRLLLANAFSQLSFSLTFVVGSAVAGVLVGVADATAPAFIIDSLTFFVSAYFILRLSISGRVERKEKSKTAPRTGLLHTLRTITGDLIVGVRYTLSDQIMRGTMISFVALFLGLGAANVTFIPLLTDELGMAESGIGPIRFSQTVGIILGSALVTGSLAARYRARDLIGGTMLIFGFTTIIVSVVNNFLLMIAVLFAVGLVISPPQIVASTLIQRHVPNDKLGRAGGVQNTLVTVSNIVSMGAAGRLMDQIGARMLFRYSGLLICVAGIVSWWVLRGVEDASDPVTADEMAAEELSAAG